MPLTTEQESWLSDLLAKADDGHDRLSQWENAFVADQRRRYEEFGSDIGLSTKQWGVLLRIEEKLDR